MVFRVTGWAESVARVVEVRVDAATALDAKAKAEELGLVWVVVETPPPSAEDESAQ